MSRLEEARSRYESITLPSAFTATENAARFFREDLPWLFGRVEGLEQENERLDAEAEGYANQVGLLERENAELLSACESLLNVYKFGEDYVEAVMQISRVVEKVKGSELSNRLDD